MKKVDPARNMGPRRRPDPPSMTEAFTPRNSSDEGTLVHLTIQIPEDTRRQLKTIAAAEGLSIRAIVLAGIAHELDARKQ